MRYLVGLLVLLALQFAPGLAAAATYPTISEAYAACMADEAGYWQREGISSEHYVREYECRDQPQYSQIRGFGRFASPAVMVWSSWDAGVKFGYTAGCEGGVGWNDDLGMCNPSPAECLAKPPLGASLVKTSSSFSTACSEGCSFEWQPNSDGVDVQFLDESTGEVVGLTTGWRPTGEACAAGDPVSEPMAEPQYCEQLPFNQTVCVKPNGDHCYSLPVASGNQVCWRAGETGEKTSANAIQVRNAGGEPVVPVTAPPAGDSFQQDGQPMTQVSTVGGTTITTTTTNYTTQNGTSAGSKDYGEPGDGSGGPGDGDGEGFGDCSDCDLDEGAGGHEGDSIWGEDETVAFQGDESGFGFSRSCPAPPEILDGTPLDWSGLCTLMQWVGLLVLAAAHMHAIYIMLGD